MTQVSAFECDLTPPDEGASWPRVRYNFANGWTASVIYRTRNRGSSVGTEAAQAALAHWPTGKHGTGVTVIGETEASPEEVAEFLALISKLPPPGTVLS